MKVMKILKIIYIDDEREENILFFKQNNKKNNDFDDFRIIIQNFINNIMMNSEI